MSCGDSNTCAQETLHTQGSSLSCNTISQFSAKRHQKEPLCIFNWLKSSQSFCSHHFSHHSTHRVPAKIHTVWKKIKTGAGGRGRQGHYHKAQCKSSALVKQPLKKIAGTAGKCPLQAFVCACNISTQPLSHSCSCHSRHKTSIFPHFLRMRAGWVLMIHNQDCCPHCLPRKTAGTDCIIPLSVYGLKGVWVRFLPNKDHPPKIQKKVAGGFGTPCNPIRQRDTETGWVAGGKSRRLKILSTLHFQLLSLYAAHESEKHL